MKVQNSFRLIPFVFPLFHNEKVGLTRPAWERRGLAIGPDRKRVGTARESPGTNSGRHHKRRTRSGSTDETRVNRLGLCSHNSRAGIAGDENPPWRLLSEAGLRRGDRVGTISAPANTHVNTCRNCL
jgi:hypothetical protein